MGAYEMSPAKIGRPLHRTITNRTKSTRLRKIKKKEKEKERMTAIE